MSISLQRLPFDLHVLCAPPAFILSQDQTLLFVVFIFHSFECYKSKLKCFIKLLNFLLFIELKTFKKFYFSVLIFRFKNHTASVYSLKDLLFTFQCTFCSPLRWTICIIQYVFLFVNTFFKIFSKIFFINFSNKIGIKKLYCFYV